MEDQKQMMSFLFFAIILIAVGLLFYGLYTKSLDSELTTAAAKAQQQQQDAITAKAASETATYNQLLQQQQQISALDASKVAQNNAAMNTGLFEWAYKNLPISAILSFL